MFVRFDNNGNVLPAPPVPVLTGFLAGQKTTRGRPAWVTFAKDGALLVSDDTGGVIWRIVAPGAKPATAITEIAGTPMPPAPRADAKFIVRPDADSDLVKPPR